jgi:hypothetical protein
MRSYLDRGYTVVKMKIGGATLADDLKRIEAVLGMLPEGCSLAVDANGRFDLPTAVEYARALSAYRLFWYEEAGDPLDYALHRELTEAYPGAIATGENLFSVQDVRNLLTYGGVRPDRDIFQMDAGLSYGLTEYARMIEAMESHGVDRAQAFPHGGHLINLHAAAGLGLQVSHYPVINKPEVQSALAAIAAAGADAIVVHPDALMIEERAAIGGFALERRMPAISGWAVLAEGGTLLTYGPNLQECYRRHGEAERLRGLEVDDELDRGAFRHPRGAPRASPSVGRCAPPSPCCTAWRRSPRGFALIWRESLLPLRRAYLAPSVVFGTARTGH